MNLYYLSDNGELLRVDKLDFQESDIYLVEDEKNIYIWFGLKVKQDKKEAALEKARLLNEKREKLAKIQLMNQNLEYGEFQMIMDDFKKGLKRNGNVDRSAELKLEEAKRLSGIKKDLETEIRVAAYFLSQKNLSYNDLCWLIAEKQIQTLYGRKTAPIEEVKKKAAEVYQSACSQDELTWLLAEITTLIEKKYLIVE